MNRLVEKVRAELARYEHPLFAFDARPAADGVEVEIRFKPPDVHLHAYLFLLRPREIEHAQFPWTFQKQLACTTTSSKCLHRIRSGRIEE